MMNSKAESVADIPLILEFCKKLKIDQTFNEVFGNHGNQKSLSNGKLVLGWLTHVLTQNNHCKSHVDEWANTHKLVLQALLEQPLSDIEFDDCRLSRLLVKFSDDESWHNFEKSFYTKTMSVLQLDTKAPAHLKDSTCGIDEGISKTIKCDSTTAYGHHTVFDEGIMKYGWSKDHRPDLPQVKLMVAVEGNTGVSISSETVSGNTNDDILYRPIIRKTRDIIDTQNCLFCGDCKMSSLETRADIVLNNEFYLAPLQLSNKSIKSEFDSLVNHIVNNEQSADLIYSTSNNLERKLIGSGYEVLKKQSFELCDGKMLEWEERRILIRSNEHAQNEIDQFEKKIKKIIENLLKCSSKICTTVQAAENDVNSKLSKIMNNEELRSLFEVILETQIETKSNERCEVRNGIKRQGTYKTTSYKIIIKDVRINEEMVNDMKRKLGWRLYVTNAPKKYLTFSQAYLVYRETMYVIEIGFHKIKDHLNISPLFVREQDQIIGMTRFLMLALKILTLMTAEVRATMKKEKVVLQGLYAGQSAKKHEAPTAESILKYFSRQGIHLIGVEYPSFALERENESTGQNLFPNWSWMISPLTDTCRLILKLLNISEAYDKLPIEIKRTCQMVLVN